MSPLNPKKILLIKHGSLGDIVFALEPILAIHKKFNNSVIDLVTEEKFIPFFKKIKMFDKFLVDNRGGFLSTFSLIRKILIGKYDLIIDLQNSKRTNFYHFFIKNFSSSRINGSRSFVHDRYIIPVQGQESPTQGLYNQLKLLDIDQSDPDFSWLASDKEDQSIEDKQVVLVIPGVSKSGRAKQWSPSNYQQLCSLLESKGYYICLVGTKHDTLSFQPILDGCKNVINLIDKSPPEIIYTVATNTVESHAIISASYRVYRTLDGFEAISYGTGSDYHTMLSYDVSGSYFNLDMNLLEPGYSYGLKFAFYDSDTNSWREQTQTFKFRVESYEY